MDGRIPLDTLPKLPENHKRDMVALGLVQLKGSQCLQRHVRSVAAVRHLNKIEILKNEEGRNESRWAARNFCASFPHYEAVLGGSC